MDQPAAPADAVLFDAVLHPHRSLSRRGFRILMGCVAVVTLGVGGAFFLIGAWPVFGLMGLDLGLLWLAFRINYGQARLYERILLTERTLTVLRVDHRGHGRTWQFNQPYWLRVSMDDPPEHDSQILLSSHGRHLVVGSFLSPEERLDFARALGSALARLRRPALG